MPERGRILDRFGVVLAGNEESYRATLVPSQAGDLRQTLAVFARVVPITAAEQERIVQRARRQSRSGLLLLASDLSFEQVAALGLIAPRLPGVETERSPRRRYHRGAALGHVVGHVGAVDRLALDDTPLLRVPGVRIGKAGVELAMEEELRGVAGSRRLEVDARGAVVRKLGETPPSRGRDVVLTVDAALQERVMERLKAERRAAVVALDVTRGEVVAMASVPSFDPDEIARGAAPESWQRQLADPDKPLLSRAAGGLYPPGSTFKMVTALAALEAGVVTPRERFHCDGGFDLAGQHFRCWSRSGHGRVDLHRALKVSCDVYFYELARRVGILALARMARRLGFGEVFEGGIGPQKAGVVPDPDWKRGETGRGWLGGETVLTGIGQGFVTATPLQLATMAARLATGRRVTPTLVRGEARSREGADGGGFLPLDIDPGWLDAVRRGLHAAVNEDGGTGGNAALERGTDEMAGKTGTAQISRSSSDRPQSELPWEQRDHALFAGYAPADRPRYAVAAVVEHGGGGGAVAAPLARDVMAMLLAEDPMARPGYSVTDAGRAASGRRAVTG
jgi:penicillin-binding protein 2